MQVAWHRNSAIGITLGESKFSWVHHDAKISKTLELRTQALLEGIPTVAGLGHVVNCLLVLPRFLSIGSSSQETAQELAIAERTLEDAKRKEFELSGLAQPILKKSHNRLGDSVIHVILKNGITPSHPIQCSYWGKICLGVMPFLKQAQSPCSFNSIWR